jgi:hypothetical protein
MDFERGAVDCGALIHLGFGRGDHRPLAGGDVQPVGEGHVMHVGWMKGRSRHRGLARQSP